GKGAEGTGKGFGRDSEGVEKGFGRGWIEVFEDVSHVFLIFGRGKSVPRGLWIGLRRRGVFCLWSNLSFVF
ncbi:hypothetical protein, partial [uncultured Bacteroides sp.]|uniref:hypothetical protein n=1 Tax=uncultured Bacteroides sp. TaxID=162156 RepID=UPI00267524E4